MSGFFPGLRWLLLGILIGWLLSWLFNKLFARNERMYIADSALPTHSSMQGAHSIAPQGSSTVPGSEQNRSNRQPADYPAKNGKV
jgi:hypothetical protein